MSGAYGIYIADSCWHRVGFVWDGSRRRLYADGTLVKADPAPISGLTSSSGGLYFGAANVLAAGTFLEGLIDDVRLYTRALTPQQAAALAD